jgi:hypothetical protein
MRALAAFYDDKVKYPGWSRGAGSGQPAMRLARSSKSSKPETDRRNVPIDAAAPAVGVYSPVIKAVERIYVARA